MDETQGLEETSRAGATMIAWDDPSLRIVSDSRRTARYRALQSWYREKVLEEPPGLDREGRPIASLLPAEAVSKEPGLNFLSPKVTDYVEHRSRDVLSSGGSLEEDRLRRNMLSSMPLCFNIFGFLRGEPDLLALLNELFGTDVAEIEAVECEWAPDKTRHLGDRTAFDAFVAYKDSQGQRLFLAIETKYTEPFSHKEYDSEVYQRVTAESGRFRDGAGERLVGRETNQLWRMAMLAASMIAQGEFDDGSVAVLSLVDDKHARAAVEGLKAELVDPAFVEFVSLEDLAAAAQRYPGWESWSDAFSRRYLDLSIDAST